MFTCTSVRVGFRKHVPLALHEMHTFSMMEMGIPDVCTDTRFNKTVWAKEVRNGPYPRAFVQKM